MATITLALLHGQGDFGDGRFDGPGLLFSPFIFLFWVLILGSLVWAAFRLVPRLRGGGGWTGGGRRDPAEEILRERFARGETGAEEYVRAMRTLRGNDGPTDYQDYVREAETRDDPSREPDA